MKSIGDGHCFIYSVICSMNSMVETHLHIDSEKLVYKLRKETIENAEWYKNFIENNSKDTLLRGLHEYIVNKKYDTSFGDLVPIIIANALMVNILIVTLNNNNVTLNNNNVYECQLIQCMIRNNSTQRPLHTLHVMKTGLHYDSIISVKRNCNQIEVDIRSTNANSSSIAIDRCPQTDIIIDETVDNNSDHNIELDVSSCPQTDIIIDETVDNNSDHNIELDV